MQRDQHPDDELHRAADEFGDAWERACYKAATQGMINVLIGVGVIFAALFILGWLGLIRPADGSAVCLTKHEARQLWPKKHLYWYSPHHCWSNRRGGPPTGVKYDLIRENHAQAEAAPAPPMKQSAASKVIKIVKWQDYNELDAQADADTFFNAKPFTYQQYVLNLDRYKATFWYSQIWGLAKEGK